jgi:hypothetical protein
MLDARAIQQYDAGFNVQHVACLTAPGANFSGDFS